MIALLGALIIIGGFISPIFSIGETSSILFFWIGFLVLFASREYYPRHALWMKWASRGVLLNAVGVFVFLQYLEVVLTIKQTNITSKILMGGGYIVYPSSHILKLFFPHLYIDPADGVLTFAMRYLRITVASFLNVLVYIGISVLIGKLFFIKHAKYASEKKKMYHLSNLFSK